MPYDYMPNDDNESYKKTVAMCVAAASLVVLLFLVVLYINSDKANKAKMANANAIEEVEDENVLRDEHSNLKSEDLSFWNDVSKSDEEEVSKEPEVQATPYKDPDKKSSSKDNSNTVKDDEYNEDEVGEGSLMDLDDDDEVDENHIAVVDKDNKKKLYEIIPTLEKNDYDFEENLTQTDDIISYKDDSIESRMGLNLSNYNGNVDFGKVKDAGVDFVMLRLGSRGYGTGVINLDEKFVEYAQNAAVNNILIGAYFSSQAITETEAIEEANYTVGAIGTFNVKYPVAIDIEDIGEDDARTSDLTVKERTAIVKAFCDTVKNYGYKPVVCASRDMLIAGLDLEELDSYDVWVSDGKIPTDYPYDFSMWKYNKSGKIDGIDGRVDLSISFKNYEKR